MRSSFLISSLLLLFFWASCDAKAIKKTPAFPPPKTVAKAAASNPTDAFCQAFTTQCFEFAFTGQVGHVKVVHACRRNGGKYSSSYSFGCTIDGFDVTQPALDNVGGGYSVTVTKGSTVVVTGTVTDVATSKVPITSTVLGKSTVSTLSTSTKTTINVGTVTNVQTTTLTTVIPVTSTSTSSTKVTVTVPVTATSTSIFTTVSLATQAVPILQVAFQAPPSRKRLNKVDDSVFCSAFNAGCTSQCARVHSTPSHVLCHTPKLDQYSLTCYCKDGHIETQHALAAALDQVHVTTVTTLATSTTFATVTTTTVVPTTILSTSIQTVTSTIPVVNTFTSLSTATSTVTSTLVTGASSVVATTTPITTIPTTTTVTVATSTLTSTTQIVLPTKGAILVQKQSDSSTLGYLNHQVSPRDNFAYYYFQPSEPVGTTFMAVLDPASNLYQLQEVNTPNVFIAEAGYNVNYSSATYFSDPSAYSVAYSGIPTLCGAAGSKAAPAAGSGNRFNHACETFVFAASADGKTVTSGAILQSEWVNPGQTQGKQYSWLVDHLTPALYGISNYATFSLLYSTEVDPGLVNLRFPA